jgi:hypothetical protein
MSVRSPTGEANQTISWSKTSVRYLLEQSAVEGMQNATHGTLCFQHDLWAGKSTKLGTFTVGVVRSLAPVFGSFVNCGDKLIFVHR